MYCHLKSYSCTSSGNRILSESQNLNCNDETNVTIAALVVVTVVDVVSTMNSVQIGNVTLEILLVIVLFLKRMEMVGFKIH